MEIETLGWDILDFTVPVEHIAELTKRMDEPELRRFMQSMNASQVASKRELITQLADALRWKKCNFVVIGSWYGTLTVPYILNNFDVNTLHMYDIDPTPNEFAKAYTKRQLNKNRFLIDSINVFDNSWWKEQLDPEYPTVIINTSCEHMPDMAELDVPSGTIFALQSNDLFDCEEHTNCVENNLEFAVKADVDVMYSTSLDCQSLNYGPYKRFTLIGTR